LYYVRQTKVIHEYDNTTAMKQRSSNDSEMISFLEEFETSYSCWGTSARDGVECVRAHAHMSGYLHNIFKG